MERLEFDLLFRWFVGLTADEPAWDASTFSKNAQIIHITRTIERLTTPAWHVR
jgi:hypothetical protein